MLRMVTVSAMIFGGLVWVAAAPAVEVEIVGQVARVQGEKLLISPRADVTFQVGDRLDVFVEIPGAGPATVASAEVTDVAGNSVAAKVLQATGRVDPGQHVRRIATAAQAPPKPKHHEPPQTASAPPPSWRLFSYVDKEEKKGCFVQLEGRDWIEVTIAREGFFFREVARGEGWIELIDSSRGEEGVGVRLSANQSQWKSKEGTEGNWAPLWVGTWLAVPAHRPFWAVFAYTDNNGRKGCFVHPDAEDWIELTGTKEKFTFREVGRRDGWIELFDESREGIGVRLFQDKSEWRSQEKTQGNWAPLWPGAWIVSSAAEPGKPGDPGARKPGPMAPPMTPSNDAAGFRDGDGALVAPELARAKVTNGSRAIAFGVPAGHPQKASVILWIVSKFDDAAKAADAIARAIASLRDSAGQDGSSLSHTRIHRFGPADVRYTNSSVAPGPGGTRWRRTLLYRNVFYIDLEFAGPGPNQDLSNEEQRILQKTKELIDRRFPG